MTDIIVRSIETIEPYRGEHEIPGIRFRLAAAALGVTAWGMNILELEPGCTGAPEHDHTADGQEEVYVLLRGAATLVCGDERWPLPTGTLVRVGPQVTRKLVTEAEGATILAIGATPGKTYGS